MSLHPHMLLQSIYGGRRVGTQHGLSSLTIRWIGSLQIHAQGCVAQFGKELTAGRLHGAVVQGGHGYELNLDGRCAFIVIIIIITLIIIMLIMMMMIIHGFDK